MTDTDGGFAERKRKHMGALSRSELVKMMHSHPSIMDKRHDAAAAT